MSIDFTGHQLEVTDALKAHTEDKFRKIKAHFDNITSIHVVFKVEKLQQIAEGTILVAKNKFHASAEDENLYTAIDSMADKLNRQMVEHKQKSHAYHRD
jgi:putative sigma-54 modulation protein